MNKADLIIDRIWIGDLNSSQDKDFLRKNNINVIVNCTKDLPNIFEPFTIKDIDEKILDECFIKYYRINANDNGRDDEKINFWNDAQSIVLHILDKYKEGKNILIHCAAGQQRSCTFCFYLMTFLGYKKDDAIKIIISKREQAFNYGKEFHFL